MIAAFMTGLFIGVAAGITLTICWALAAARKEKEKRQE
jgi:hypothetical protein